MARMDPLPIEACEDPELRAMLEAFDSLPPIPMPNGKTADLNDPGVLAEVKSGWLRDGLQSKGWWNPESSGTLALQGRASSFFLSQYRKVAQH